MPRGCSRSEKGREALAGVMRTQDGIDFLGYRIFPTHRLLRQTTARWFVRRLCLQSKLYARHLLSLQCIDRSVQSWLGHATHVNTCGLRWRVFRAIAFAVNKE
jgi:RNA-directed DNA polymerase